MIKKMSITNLGPIKQADVKFGDLTVLVGPQATGKTIFLQFYKLVDDIRNIVDRYKKNDLHWEKNLSSFLELYLGEGMGSIWTEKSILMADNKNIDVSNIINKGYDKNVKAKCFYVPAQRFLTMENGWPKTFAVYDDSYPFILRDFSDIVNDSLKPYRDKSSNLYPMPQKFNSSMRDKLNESIFENSTLRIRKGKNRHIIELNPIGSTGNIALTGISAGQREFIPYLLGLYFLLPSGLKGKVENIDTVIIEEIEIGLHPKAIGHALLTILELMKRGYKVILSTHSPILLDYIWAMKEINSKKLKEKDLTEFYCNLFQINPCGFMNELTKDIVKKKINLFYFKPENFVSSTVDISSMDIDSDDPAIFNWGGLTEFSNHVSDVIADLYSKE